jgi:exonuclease VII large subunit
LTYKADANGFIPQGDHLPKPVELPAEYYEQVELQRKIAAEIEAEGQRILQLQAELAAKQPQQQNQYQQHQQQQPNYNYNAQASNTVYQQAQGYNHNAQPVGSARPQQNYLPPQNYGKK